MSANIISKPPPKKNSLDLLRELEPGSDDCLHLAGLTYDEVQSRRSGAHALAKKEGFVVTTHAKGIGDDTAMVGLHDLYVWVL